MNMCKQYINFKYWIVIKNKKRFSFFINNKNNGVIRTPSNKIHREFTRRKYRVEGEDIHARAKPRVESLTH